MDIRGISAAGDGGGGGGVLQQTGGDWCRRVSERRGTLQPLNPALLKPKLMDCVQ